MKLKESLLSRRWFLTGLIYGALGFLSASVLYPVVKFLFHKKKMPLPVGVRIAKAEIVSMKPNSAAYFKYGHMSGILLKTEEGELRAFDAKCTHLDCNVYYQPESKKFHCACHDGFFNDLGINIAGPPPAPLPLFSIEDEGDMFVVSIEGKNPNLTNIKQKEEKADA